MAQSSTRIWETPSDQSSQPARHSHPAQLPSIATLTHDFPPGGANGPVSPPYANNNNANRASDPFSQAPSARSSAYSSGLTNLNYSSGVTSPHRASNSSQLGSTSHPYDHNTAPTSAGAQASPGFASPHSSIGLRSPHDSMGLPNLNQQYQQQDPNQYRNSDGFPPQESRRSSLGSQVNSGLSNMHLNGAVTSPYANSNNQSQSSIAASLQRERGIPQPSGVRNSGLSNSSTHMSQQPVSPFNPLPGESRQAFTSRTAPIISANPIKEVYNAEKPTAGQPYAFPDPDMSGGSSGNSMHDPNGSTMLSRRNSDHTSITSSIVTNDSKLPKGQHRLDEDPMPGTHHHSLQNKHVSSVAGESDSPDAASPYSRTPALRASHKMAERKRRTEMKYLFEQLRNQIPASHGSKSSKWEILSKASEHINLLEKSLQQSKDAQQQLANASAQMDAVRQEIENLRNENHHLYQEMQHYREQARPSTATALHPQTAYAPPPPPTAVAPMIVDQSRSLPPLTTSIAAGAGSMQGVQYTEERR